MRLSRLQLYNCQEQSLLEEILLLAGRGEKGFFLQTPSIYHHHPPPTNMQKKTFYHKVVLEIKEKSHNYILEQGK